MWRAGKLILLIMVSSIIITPCGQTSEYYFDSEAGSDENPGTSEVKPFRSLEKLAQMPLRPGDIIRFRRGSVWRAQLNFQGNGVKGEPIHITTYGEGPKPEFLASVRPMRWIHHDDQVYSIAIPEGWLVGDPEVNGAFHYPPDGVPVRLRKSKQIPSDKGRYYYDSENRNLYVITWDGKSPMENPIEISVITPLLDLADRSWIQIEDLAFLFGGRNHWRLRNCKNIIIRDCAALFVGDKNPAVVISNGSEHIEIIGCFVYNSVNNGIKMTSGATRCQVRNCTVVKGLSNDGITCHNGLPNNRTGDHNVIENNVIGLWPENSVDITSGDYHVVRGNFCYNDRQSNIVIGHGADHILVQNNICVGSRRRGIQIGGNDEEGSRGRNMIYQNLTINAAYPGVEVDRNNTKVYNNTVVNSRDRPGIRISAKAKGSDLRNNLVVVLDPEIPHPCIQVTKGDPSMYDLKFSHNMFFHMGRPDGRVLHTKDGYFTPGDFLTRYGTGEDSSIPEPIFADAFPRYYFLTKDSPCVDAGTDASLTFTGKAPDVGWKDLGMENEAPAIPEFLIRGEDDTDAILYLWGKTDRKSAIDTSGVNW